MSKIIITDGQTDRVLDHINREDVLENKHERDKSTWIETFTFTAFGDKRYAEYLTDRNRVIIPDEDGTYRELVIKFTDRYKGSDGVNLIDVDAYGSYQELQYFKIIPPERTAALTAEEHARQILSGTEVYLGHVDYTGVRTITRDNYTDAFSALKSVANEFDLELNFRVEVDDGQVRRFADLVDRIGEWRGRIVEFGKDLQNIKRTEETDNIVTALLAIGPEREDGTRLEVLVEDEEARQRWGRRGQHIIDTYEPQSEDQNMTLSRLRSLGRTELNKRINKVVTYEINVQDLEHLPAMENKEIRFGDTIRVKDTTFNPPLFVEARIFKQSRDIFYPASKQVTLGDFVEYSVEDVYALWRQVRDELTRKISFITLEEYTYTQEQIDRKDSDVYELGKQFAEAIGNTAMDHADSVGDRVLDDAVDRAEQVAQERVEAAMLDAVNREVYEREMQRIAEELEGLVSVEELNGRLVLKADQELVESLEEDVVNINTSITNIEGELGGKVDTTTYTTDINGILETLETTTTQVSLNTEAIDLKADATAIDAINNTISDYESRFSVMADAIESRVTSVEVNNMLNRLDIVGTNLFIGPQGQQREVTEAFANIIGAVTFDKNDIEIGDTFTISFYGTFPSSNYISLSSIGLDPATTDLIFPWQFVSSSSSERYYEFTVTVNRIPVTGDENLIKVIRYPTRTFKIRDLKIERGDRATAYEPPFQYFESRITQLSDSITSFVTDGEVTSMIRQEVDNITLSANQINFNGHVFGQGATFEGHIRGASFEGGSIEIWDPNRVGELITIDAGKLQAFDWETTSFIEIGAGELTSIDIRYPSNPKLNPRRIATLSQGQLKLGNNVIRSDTTNWLLEIEAGGINVSSSNTVEMQVGSSSSGGYNFSAGGLDMSGTLYAGEVRVGNQWIRTSGIVTNQIYSRYRTTRLMINDHNNGNVSINAVGGDLYLGNTNTNGIQIEGSTSLFFNGRTNSGSEIYNDSGAYFRIRSRSNSHNGSIIINKSNQSISFYQNGSFRHQFNSNGTKSGGSIEIDGKILGMSPTDSPQSLIETIEFDIPLSSEGTVVYLDENFLKAVNYTFAVFVNNGTMIEKGKDYFIVSGEGYADARIIGERHDEVGRYFTDLSLATAIES